MAAWAQQGTAPTMPGPQLSCPSTPPWALQVNWVPTSLEHVVPSVWNTPKCSFFYFISQLKGHISDFHGTPRFDLVPSVWSHSTLCFVILATFYHLHKESFKNCFSSYSMTPMKAGSSSILFTIIILAQCLTWQALGIFLEEWMGGWINKWKDN